MSDSIKISPKYGVNPTIPVCFWCGKEKNEIALLGRIRRKETRKTAYGTTVNHTVDDDMEAPRNMVLDYEPCDACREQFLQGVQVIECDTASPDERMPISKDDTGNPVYPTGRFVVLKPEAVKRIFHVDPDMTKPGKKLCMDRTCFADLFANIL